MSRNLISIIFTILLTTSIFANNIHIINNNKNTIKTQDFMPITLLSFKISKTQNISESMHNSTSISNNLTNIDDYISDTSRYNLYLHNIVDYASKTKKEENIFRRMEILFFGSLTIVSFSGWFAFSIFNIIIYGDSFGVIRKEQFLTLYLGSSAISLSVSISDLINNLKKKNKDKFKYVDFY